MDTAREIPADVRPRGIGGRVRCGAWGWPIFQPIEAPISPGQDLHGAGFGANSAANFLPRTSVSLRTELRASACVPLSVSTLIRTLRELYERAGFVTRLAIACYHAAMKPGKPKAQPAPPKPETRMLTPSEIESLRRDKAESGKRLLAMFRADRLKTKVEP